MSRITIMAAASGLTLIVWGIAFARRDPPPSPPPPPKEVSRPTLQERWTQGEWTDTEAAPLIKGPRLVQTVKVNPEPVEVAEVKKLEPPEQPVHHYRKKVKRERTRSNVCSRHHMRKVMVGKYKWRCRR